MSRLCSTVAEGVDRLQELTIQLCIFFALVPLGVRNALG